MVKTRAWFLIVVSAGVAASASVLAWQTGYLHPIQTAQPKPDSLLNIPLEQTAGARKEFLTAYQNTKLGQARELYEEYLPRIGANGIRQAIETAKPFCHEEAHDLGKLIFTKLRDVGESLESCADACSSGCMHGVLMEFFAEPASKEGAVQSHAVIGESSPPPSAQEHSTQHAPTGEPAHHHSAQLTPAEVAQRIPTFCESATWNRVYGPGDCAHGVGHAAMFLSNYDIPAGIDLCDRFRSYPLRYYCATGAYMEYWINPKFRLNYFAHGPLYPCTSVPYPAACFKYILGNTVRWHYAKGGTLEALSRLCAGLNDKYRLGCFHGLGFAHIRRVELGKNNLAELCGFGSREEQTACLEGAMEQLGKANPFVDPARCESLTDWRLQACRAAAARKKYDMTKSFALYGR